MQVVLKQDENVRLLVSYNVFNEDEYNEVFVELLSCDTVPELPLVDGFNIAHTNSVTIAEAIINRLVSFCQTGESCETLFNSLKAQA